MAKRSRRHELRDGRGRFTPAAPAVPPRPLLERLGLRPENVPGGRGARKTR